MCFTWTWFVFITSRTDPLHLAYTTEITEMSNAAPRSSPALAGSDSLVGRHAPLLYGSPATRAIAQNAPQKVWWAIAMSILTYFQARGALHMLGQWPGYVCALSRNEVILIFRFMYSKYRIVGSAGVGCVVARYEPWKATFQSVTRTTPYLECVDKIKIPDWISPILQIPSN